jgi:hypothetical protein
MNYNPTTDTLLQTDITTGYTIHSNNTVTVHTKQLINAHIGGAFQTKINEFAKKPAGSGQTQANFEASLLSFYVALANAGTSKKTNYNHVYFNLYCPTVKNAKAANKNSIRINATTKAHLCPAATIVKAILRASPTSSLRAYMRFPSIALTVMEYFKTSVEVPKLINKMRIPLAYNYLAFDFADGIDKIKLTDDEVRVIDTAMNITINRSRRNDAFTNALEYTQGGNQGASPLAAITDRQ